jgi:hypothetical protein
VTVPYCAELIARGPRQGTTCGRPAKWWACDLPVCELHVRALMKAELIYPDDLQPIAADRSL